jgi:hypothetical protein
MFYRISCLYTINLPILEETGRRQSYNTNGYFFAGEPSENKDLSFRVCLIMIPFYCINNIFGDIKYYILSI